MHAPSILILHPAGCFAWALVVQLFGSRLVPLSLEIVSHFIDFSAWFACLDKLFPSETGAPGFMSPLLCPHPALPLRSYRQLFIQRPFLMQN